ncbi:MAG: cell envelope integrity protein TolA [Desulfocapsaceae bacterium]|nr:cell envelope integrity protein TolA [Desulfocapsaceae bacterium]
MNNEDWKIPFNFALALHVLVISGVTFLPGMFKNDPLFPDIYTVDLINVAAPIEEPVPTPQQETAPPKIEPEQKIVEPKQPEKAVSIAEKEPVVEPEVIKDPISIKPLKKKKIHKNIAKETEAQQKALERIRQQRLQEAREAERRAEEAARIAAEEAARLAADEAVDQLREMLRETTVANNTQESQSARQTQGGSRQRSKNVLERQYYASVFNTLQPHWKLPGHKMWDPDLSAIVVVHIASSGDITRRYFEHRSGDRIFDQFVLKALEQGAPLPAIPAALGKRELEIGLKFTVDSIQ